MGPPLDMFTVEPLPETSPLRVLSSVLLRPHATDLSLAENERIVELFADNLLAPHEPAMNGTIASR